MSLTAKTDGSQSAFPVSCAEEQGARLTKECATKVLPKAAQLAQSLDCKRGAGLAGMTANAGTTAWEVMGVAAPDIHYTLKAIGSQGAERPVS